jgi:hypothetical protein
VVLKKLVLSVEMVDISLDVSILVGRVELA